MSSPLDGRIRTLAREEAAALLGVGTPTAAVGADPKLAALEKEVAELRSLVGALSARLDVGEKATITRPPTGRRPARKDSDDKHSE